MVGRASGGVPEVSDFKLKRCTSIGVSKARKDQVVVAIRSDERCPRYNAYSARFASKQAHARRFLVTQ